MFSLGVTAEALRQNMIENWRFRSNGVTDPKFQVEGIAPINQLFCF